MFMRQKSQMSTQLTQETCDNIGGYFISDSATTESRSTEPTAVTSPGLSIVAGCYYESFNCSGYEYNGQCYSGSSSQMSCPTCNNIGGVYSNIASRCYYYSNECEHFYAGVQCHTNRWCKQRANILSIPQLLFSVVIINFKGF